MITRVQIKNFKCYGEPAVDIPLKRINFIFGDNGAGKSSFLQFLRMSMSLDGMANLWRNKEFLFKNDDKRKMGLRITATVGCERKIYEYPAMAQGEGSLDSRFPWLPRIIHQEAARPKSIAKAEKRGGLVSEMGRMLMLSTREIEYANRFFKKLGLSYSAKSGGRLVDDMFGVEVSTGNTGAGIDGLYATALKLCEWKETAEKLSPESAGVMLALEEPESHVNERQISPLVDFLFREAKEVPNGQLVVECHSELMALKVKNILRSGMFSPADVAILYALKVPAGTEVVEIKVDEKGNFKTRWPDGGFFVERAKIVDEFFRSCATG